jgi:hypothetical protein
MYQEMYPILEYNEQIGRIGRSYTPAIYWTNFPEINNFKNKNLGFLITTQLRLGFLKNVVKPTIIYTGTNYIYELEQAEYDQEIIDYLNTVGLDIYFYEPLCFRDSTSHNRSFYSEFFGDTPISTISCDEFDSLDYFCRKNNLTNVNVYSGEYKIQLLQDNYPRLKLHCFDIFIRSLDHKHQYNVLKSNIKKKFWCGNWRYATHRHLITSYLANYNGTYSWHINCKFEKLRDNIWFDIDKLELFEPELFLKLKAGSDLLEKDTFTIDKNNPAISVEDVDSVHIPGNVAPLVTDTFIESYADCFCAVVNETRFAQPFANISEKTLNPMRAKIPLILVGPPYSLEYLKTFGFKTFDSWWDESYDLEEDHETRMLMIFKLIDYINNKSLEELNVIYQEMQEILENNFNIVKSYKQMNLNFTIL